MSIRNPTILVADDDPDDQEFIQEAVEMVCRGRVAIDFVGDGIALIETLKKDGRPDARPDLIILDLNMPRRDGRVCLKDIKSDQSLAAIPVVILTTSRSEEDRQLCRMLGAQGYYQKPNRARELEEIFDTLCREYLPQSM
jgi:CheY-like chemotaxis protein